MPLEVHAHHRIPVFFAQADKHPVAQDACVVDHHVHLAKRRQCGIDDVLGSGRRRDVVIVGDGLAARVADFCYHRFGRFTANIVDQHIRALRRECQRVGPAQAAACARNDDGTSFTNCHVSAPVRGAR